MISQASYLAKGEQYMTQHAIGTGPFKAVSFQQSVGFKTVRNPAYWKKDDKGNKLPYLDAIDYTFVADPITMKMYLQAKQIDMATLSLSDSSLTKDGVVFHDKISGNEYLVPDIINADSPWSNKSFREAVEIGRAHV